MIRGIFFLLTLLLCNVAVAADFTIGYLQLQDDPRYSSKRSFAQYLMQPLGRPYAGAEVALKESKFHGAAVGAEFKLQQVKGKDTADLVAQVDSLGKQGVQFFVVDAPAATVAELAAATRGKDILLFNISAREDSLRQAQCQAHLLHMIPNYAMLTDALSQYLKVRKWPEALLLHGASDEDLQLAAAFERSAKRYGVDITEKRPFELSNDPRHRSQNNVALLTSEADYDVIFVADTHGEFARNVPYQSIRPQLVVGSEGLAPVAWHWAWDRHGAPQLEKRFEKYAGRPMRDVDWAAWMAVKAIAEAVQRSASTDFAKLRDYLLSDAFILDGFKGKRSNFRPWDHQLRQPVLLGTHNWVVERLPLDGFLHQTNNLDTLGFDERDSQCKF